jgi:hypothetical protein
MDKTGSFKNKDVEQTITSETMSKFGKRWNTYRYKKSVYEALRPGVALKNALNNPL